MKIPQYLRERFTHIISKFNLLSDDVDTNKLLGIIEDCENAVSQAKNQNTHYEQNFLRVSAALTKVEKSLLAWKKNQLINSKPTMSFLCDYLHGNLNSRAYHKYEGFETDLTFWEWCELRDYVTYQELIEDYWQLNESNYMWQIREGNLDYVLGLK